MEIVRVGTEGTKNKEESAKARISCRRFALQLVYGCAARREAQTTKSFPLKNP
jgi:hypothetical protein